MSSSDKWYAVVIREHPMNEETAERVIQHIEELERQLTNVSMFLEGAKMRKRQGQRSLAFEALAVIDEARDTQA